ncbi:MAG: SDR family NAD(P)-dependent oxidoreductase [Alphaproteobacteria bacterium]|nr:SDR family NAD(P)-dependent oxidoreductase [Alphaproteobacteria bacterium]
MSAPVWLILGASSAIARAVARAAAADGADVLLAGRDTADLEASAADLRTRFGRRAAALDFDALDSTGHAAMLQRARDFAGEATLNLFLAFGTMPSQAEIDADPALIDGVIAANYTGAVNVLHRAAPMFEAQKAGALVVLTSVAGDRGRLKNYVYGSTKGALGAYLQGLRARLFRSGVPVVTVKPGPVDTAMSYGLNDMPLMAQPETVAAACLKAAKKGTEIVYVPFPWWPIMTIIKLIPERIFKKLNI